MTGHPDHRAVSAWTAAAVARAVPHARLLAATQTTEHAQRSADVLAAFDVMIEGDPPQTPRGELAIHVVLGGRALARKVAALRAHASQTGPLAHALGEERYAAWVAEEAFVTMSPIEHLDIPLTPT